MCIVPLLRRRKEEDGEQGRQRHDRPAEAENALRVEVGAYFGKQHETGCTHGDGDAHAVFKIGRPTSGKGADDQQAEKTAEEEPGMAVRGVCLLPARAFLLKEEE